MNTLVIEKQTGGYFKFTLNGDTANAITSIQNDLLAVGTQLHFKTGNGANIIKEQFIYPADVTIIASGTFTFTTVAQVWDKLIDIDYFAWLGGGGTGGVDRFDDLLDTFQYTGNAGKAVVVDGSELRLVPITLYNKRLFTELEDTPSSLVPNKMLVVNPAGTAVMLQDQPEQPEQLLNSVGYFDYNDLITQTTPLNAVANVALKLTNDTEGANTSTDQNPYGVSYVWDYTTNQFNFNELEVGDTIDVRVHVQVTTTSANQRVILSAKLGIGSVAEFTNIIYENQFKSAGLHEINFVAPFYMGSTYITDNPAELYLTTDASATVKVDGWYVRILRKNINIITVDYTVPDATTNVKGIVRLAGDLAGTANSPTVPELANKVPTSRTVSTTSPLLGGGALSSNLTLSIQQANSVDSGYLSNVDWSTFNGKANDNAVVKLTGDQSITGSKSFTTNTAAPAMVVTNNSTDNGILLQNTSTGNALRINNGALSTGDLIRAGKDGNVTFIVNQNGNTTAASFIKSGGTSSQFLKADGSVDSSTYALTSQLHDAVTIGTANGLSLSGQVLSLALASTSVNGALSSTDWNTFNGKQAALSGTGFVKISGTTISYDNSTYALDSAVVKVTTDQNIRGIKTFLGNQTATTLKLIAADYYNDGFITSDNGMLRLLNGTTELFKLASTGDLTANSFIKSGGTSSQFLKADGSVDSTTYQTALTNPVTGTGTTNYIPKFTGASAIGNSLIYDDGTNVGIGTASPSTQLQVVGSSFSLLRVSAAADNVAGIDFGTVASPDISRIRYNNSTNSMSIRVNSIDAVNITSGGNVGIGTTSPGYKLQVDSGSNIASFRSIGSGENNKQIVLRSGGDRSIIEASNASDGTDTNLAFNTASNERMRITSGGRVGIGFTSPVAKLSVRGEDNTSSNFAFEAANGSGNSLFYVRNDGATFVVGTITSSGGFFNSDIRLKDLTDYDYNISDIKPITYLWKDGRDNKKHVGYSAQEVQKVMPDAVNEGTDGMLSVNYVEILVAKISQMEKEIAYLKSKI